MHLKFFLKSNDLTVVVGFWVKTREVKCPSHSVVSRICSAHVDLERLPTAGLVSFLHCEVFSPLCFPNCVLWKDVTSNTEWGVRLPLLRVKNLHNLFGILLYMRFASSHGEILKL